MLLHRLSPVSLFFCFEVPGTLVRWYVSGLWQGWGIRGGEDIPQQKSFYDLEGAAVTITSRVAIIRVHFSKLLLLTFKFNVVMVARVGDLDPIGGSPQPHGSGTKALWSRSTFSWLTRRPPSGKLRLNT